VKIPKYMTPKDAEALRAEALGVKGVTYDSRSNRYTADITIDGKRVRLGSFLTVIDASEAYEARRKAQPVVRPSTYRKSVSGPTVKDSFAEFLAEKGTPYAGDKWTTPDGQVFRYIERKFSRQRGKRLSYYMFASHCRVCGTEYDTLVPASVVAMVGVARNCEEHRKPHRFKRKEVALSAASETSSFEDLV